MFDHIEKTAHVPMYLPTCVSVKVHSVHTSGPLLANVSINLNDCFAVHGIKVVQGEHGPFVSMPSYKAGGEYKEICFPITKEFRKLLHYSVLEAYRQELTQLTQRGQTQKSQEAPFPQQSQQTM